MIQTKRALSRLLKTDPLLNDYKRAVIDRLEAYARTRGKLSDKEALSDFANGYMYFGFHKTERGIVFREWLPGADEVYLCGDFNCWSKTSHPLERLDSGVWEIAFEEGNMPSHGQYVKLSVVKNGTAHERVPSYIRYTGMDPATHRLCGRVWLPEKEFEWTDKKYKHKKCSTLIYEAHVGMATEECRIGTYREFADDVLPRIKRSGYGTVQLMAVQEHPYYASFGYQVSNYFAPSHRFGEPEDLKYLVNKAHEMGISVILDIVHSHACANEGEGLSYQDGTSGQYFHEGERGHHPAWETRCFDYARPEVMHFLLSNLKYWQEEFHFDGFRFDGVTSMLYKDHGLGVSFLNYSQYFTSNTDIDACVYLMLANETVHGVNKYALTVAEDMSGMPALCLPLSSGGFGFDMRLSMGVPDMWIRLIKKSAVEDWDVGYIYSELSGGRRGEKAIGYAESHDQALVGDQTVIFRLAGANMYTEMSKSTESAVIDAATELHKLIRFSTAALAKDGYLNFMGNEFGHPEWIDFPREGNGWSYQYARRQWSLAFDESLRYCELYEFDREMIAFIKKHRLYDFEPKPVFIDGDKNIMIFRRGDLIFAFNFNPTRSDEDVFISCEGRAEEKWRAVFSSDSEKSGGSGRISQSYVYTAESGRYGKGFTVYLPCRTVAVFAPEK